MKIVSSVNRSSQSASFLQGEDIHSEWLSDYLNPELDRFYDRAFDHILGKLNLGADSSILDAGCGYCHHTRRLARGKGIITAVDFSEVALSAASRTIAAAGIQDRVRLSKGDLTSLQFESESFDAVVSWGVLMHIPQLESALLELVRVLRRGGCLVLCENNMNSLDARIRLAAIRALKRWSGRKNRTATATERGLEVWSAEQSGGLMVRLADISYLVNFLAGQGLELVERRAAQFSEAYVNAPTRGLKKMVYRLNEQYFRLNLWPGLSLGNVLVFRKRF